VATKENATPDAKAAVQISIEPSDPRDPIIATAVVFSDVHRARAEERMVLVLLWKT
jgi:hypothetical protein